MEQLSSHDLVVLATSIFSSSTSLPRINLLKAIETGRSGDPAAVAASTDGEIILSTFVLTGLPVRLGCSIASGGLMLSLQLTSPSDIGSLTLEGQLILGMLGLHSLQPNLEDASPGFANRCLELFSATAEVAVAGIELNLRLKIANISLASTRKAMRHHASGRLVTDDRKALFYMSPEYLALSGRDLDGSFSEAALEAGRRAAVGRCISTFWSEVAAVPYKPADLLYDVVGEQLRRWFESSTMHGKRPQLGAVFDPKTKLQLYLWGRAGTGKSAFVTAFRRGTENVLNSRFNKTQKVAVVKVPLNSMSPADLKRDLLVRGISDWSVERMIEQNLAKDQVVVLHLEEVPESFELQKQFHDLIKIVMSKLEARYPEARHKVVCLWTSNYPCSSSALVPEAAVVEVEAPDSATQHEIAEMVLSKAIDAAVPDEVSCLVELEVGPPTGDDMRPIALWKNCLAYHTAELVAKVRSNESSARIMNDDGLGFQPDCTLVGLTTEGSSVFDEVISVATSDSVGRENSRFASSALVESGIDPLSSTSLRKLKIKIMSGSDRNVRILIQRMCGLATEMTLSTEDGLFFWEAASDDSNLGCSNDSLSPTIKRKVDALLGMVRTGMLAPGVIVITGSPGAAGNIRDSVAQLARARFDKILAETHVEIRDEEDTKKVIGSAWDFPRGGIFKFLDEVTNPHSVSRKAGKTIGAIFVDTNTEGQYMLRELLEGNRSETHRQSISKNGALFVITLDESADITGTLRSRSHVIIRA